MENLESLFRHMTEKNKATTSQTERSLFQEEFYIFQDFDLESNIGNPLLISKSDLDLKRTEINPKILESYLLDSLW